MLHLNQSPQKIAVLQGVFAPERNKDKRSFPKLLHVYSDQMSNSCCSLCIFITVPACKKLTLIFNQFDLKTLYFSQQPDFVIVSCGAAFIVWNQWYWFPFKYKDCPVPHRLLQQHFKDEVTAGLLRSLLHKSPFIPQFWLKWILRNEQVLTLSGESFSIYYSKGFITVQPAYKNSGLFLLVDVDLRQIPLNSSEPLRAPPASLFWVFPLKCWRKNSKARKFQNPPNLSFYNLLRGLIESIQKY